MKLETIWINRMSVELKMNGRNPREKKAMCISHVHASTKKALILSCSTYKMSLKFIFYSLIHTSPTFVFTLSEVSSAQSAVSADAWRSLAFPLAVLLLARRTRAERVSPPGEERRDRRFDVFIETQTAAARAATLVSANLSFYTVQFCPMESLRTQQFFFQFNSYQMHMLLQY